MDVEEEVRELRALLEKTIAVTEDTNRVVRSMRRGSRVAFLFQLLWWSFILGATGYSYYYFVQPQVAKIERLYGLTQEQSQSWNEQVDSFLKFFNQETASTTTSSAHTPR